jgi:hypothetical protein
MGAWAADSFGNDQACDWAYDLEKVKDLSLVKKALAKVASCGDEYLDSDDACDAIAACEVLSRLRGNWGFKNAYSSTVDAWVAAHPIQVPPALIEQAIAVIDRITSEPSELLELWQEGDGSEWLDHVADLRGRLVAQPP